jgi:hypothetical protein
MTRKRVTTYISLGYGFLFIIPYAPSERKKLDSQERVGEHGFGPKQTEQNLFPS